MMRLFDLLLALDSDLDPKTCKLHLARQAGADRPLDIFMAGDFDSWQTGQSKRNFERPHVISLIELPEPQRWLFVGAYDSRGSRPIPSGGYRYELESRSGCLEMNGRLVVSFKRPGRQSYLCCERWVDALEVAYIREERVRVADFRGYSWATLSKQHLDIIVREQEASWKVALAGVKGVYVIADSATGKCYVGSATAVSGVWQRWSEYAKTGHGGNRELRDLLKREGDDYSENFRFTVLEIADTHASDNDVLAREIYWKGVFMSREFGYNSN